MYIMEGLHHIRKVGNKLRGRPSDTKINIGTMHIIIYEIFKKTKITEEMNIFQDFQVISGVSCS